MKNKNPVVFITKISWGSSRGNGLEIVDDAYEKRLNRKYENGKEYWFHVLTTKGGKWYSIDKAILERLTVGDMHQAFSKMIDWSIWKKLNTKTWASMAFVMNA